MVDFSANSDLFSRIEPMELYQDQGISVSLSGKFTCNSIYISDCLQALVILYSGIATKRWLWKTQKSNRLRLLTANLQ